MLLCGAVLITKFGAYNHRSWTSGVCGTHNFDCFGLHNYLQLSDGGTDDDGSAVSRRVSVFVVRRSVIADINEVRRCGQSFRLPPALLDGECSNSPFAADCCVHSSHNCRGVFIAARSLRRSAVLLHIGDTYIIKNNTRDRGGIKRSGREPEPPQQRRTPNGHPHPHSHPHEYTRARARGNRAVRPGHARARNVR